METMRIINEKLECSKLDITVEEGSEIEIEIEGKKEKGIASFRVEIKDSSLKKIIEDITENVGTLFFLTKYGCRDGDEVEEARSKAEAFKAMLEDPETQKEIYELVEKREALRKKLLLEK